MRLAPTAGIRTYRVGHLFCGVGCGAMGFGKAKPTVRGITARFECAGGIDIDARAIDNFTRLTGTQGTVMDLFDEEQYRAWHGKAPPAGWKIAGPADIRAAHGNKPVDVMFLSAPCKGFSGLLSASKSATDKYQALNRLTVRGVWLSLEAFKDNPVRVYLFENVPRIATRGRPLLEEIKALGMIVPDRGFAPRAIATGIIQATGDFSPGLETLRCLDWWITGEESGGRKARHGDLDWARVHRDICAKAGTAFFFKQTRNKGQIPPDLLVREFPR